MPASIEERKAHIESYIRERRGEMLEALQACVRINSPSEYKEGCNEAIAFFESLAAELGAKVSHLDGGDYGGHLLLESGGGETPCIFFVGHVDTVFPLGTEWPFSIREGKAFGPGVIDMKSGVISLLYGLKALHASGGIPFAYKVLLNTDEEMGSPNSKQYLPMLAKGVDYAYIFEPAQPDGRVINTRKGIGKFDVYVSGRAAHAGKSPETGINAVLEMAHQIINAENLARKELLTTMNTGFVQGGQSAFIVAPSAHAEIESRIVVPEEQKRVEEGMAALAEHISVPGASVKVTGGFHRPPLVKRPGSERLEAAVLEAAKLMGIQIGFCMSGAASDGNNLSGFGIPVIDGMGPVGGREHSHDEYLEIESLYERTELLALSLLALIET
ncbi:MAG: M20 family metallopeptidase [Anaerolineaceae bacterium]|nr:M20 family metallopeptidase [Anaerolineaceae bacterium]